MRPDPKIISPGAFQVLGYDVPTVAKMVEERFPSTWARMFTRSIDSPLGYYSAKALPVGLTSAIEELRPQIKRDRGLDSNVGYIAGELERHDFPLYYVSSPLMDALKHSHPPKNLTWASITMPFPALCWMIPKGSLIEPEPTKGEIILIGVARFPVGSQMSIPTIGKCIASMPESRISVFWLVGPSALVSNDSTFPETELLEPSADWIDDKSEERPYNGPPGSFASYIAGLVANFILLMEARKELVEARCIISTTRSGRHVYSPTWIGRRYEVLRKSQGEAQGHMTELGWRAGHFKRQHYGPKREQEKTIFVDPYIAMTRGLKPIEKEKVP